MFEGGDANSPAIYSLTYLGKPADPIGYLEIHEEGTGISAYLKDGVGWPIDLDQKPGVVFQRVETAPGTFPVERSSTIDQISVDFTTKSQVPDGGFEIGKHTEEGWLQYGLLFSFDEPEQRNQLGTTGDTFPIPAVIDDKFRITWRTDITSTQELVEALNHDFGGGNWHEFQYVEHYSS